MEFSGSDEDFQDLLHFERPSEQHPVPAVQADRDREPACQRHAVSVRLRGQDTQLCLWDLTEDILFPTSPSLALTHTNVMNATSPHGSAGNSGPHARQRRTAPAAASNSLPHAVASSAGKGSAWRTARHRRRGQQVRDARCTTGRTGTTRKTMFNHSMGHISSKSSLAKTEPSL